MKTLMHLTFSLFSIITLAAPPFSPRPKELPKDQAVESAVDLVIDIQDDIIQRFSLCDVDTHVRKQAGTYEELPVHYLSIYGAFHTLRLQGIALAKAYSDPKVTWEEYFEMKRLYVQRARSLNGMLHFISKKGKLPYYEKYAESLNKLTKHNNSSLDTPERIWKNILADVDRWERYNAYTARLMGENSRTGQAIKALARPMAEAKEKLKTQNPWTLSKEEQIERMRDIMHVAYLTYKLYDAIGTTTEENYLGKLQYQDIAVFVGSAENILVYGWFFEGIYPKDKTDEPEKDKKSE